MLGFLAEEGGAAAWFRAAWGEFCLDFWPQKVAQQYGSEQLWGEFCLDEEGGAAAWFRAALGRVMLGFLGSKVRVERSVESIHVQNC